MKTNQFIGSVLLIAALAITISAKAQNDNAKNKAYADRYNNSDVIVSSAPGHVREHIATNWKGKYYEMMLLNNQMTDFYVEGEKIPEAKWGEYKDIIAGIREQLRKDKIQAKKDQEQAMRDEEQAKRDQEQAKLDQEQARKDQEEARRDQQQAVHDQEQAQRDQIQARKDQEQAEEDQRMMKQMISDLVSDKIIPDADSLHDLTINEEEMTVNGIKQPEDVFKKYRDKYPRFSKGSFSYGNSGNSQSIHLSSDNDK
ncbi:MAG TPA: hypothetical protein VHC47_05400 [Mucilaginibacter sp.]|nr:hypothetical protein [Mucilaginibacter sp.]